MSPFRYVVLGMDGSPRHLGWGAVYDDSGLPAGCGHFDLDSSPESLRDALAELAKHLQAAGLEPVMVDIEEAFPVSRGQAFTAGVALGMLEYAVRTRWTWVVLRRVAAASWRMRAGVDNRLRRPELKLAALRRAQALGFRPEGSDDAAEGALIAHAGWVALERGEAVRVEASAAEAS